MINCLNISESTAWDCRVLDSIGTLELCPPVTFADGAIIPVYVIPAGEGSVEITDDGGFKEHLSRCGLKAALDSRRLRTLEKTVASWGVGFDNAISIVSRNESLSFAFQRYLGALFDAARWELEILNLPPDIPRTPSVTITYAGIQLEVEYDYHRAEKPVYDVESPVCGPGHDAYVEVLAVRHGGEDIQELLDAQTLAEIEAQVCRELEE